ncbi:MAG: FecR domain-containing protein [Planctomycetes bacterium]|nr:FecR domain-containing protein [Planctomycetota bacterium]
MSDDRRFLELAEVYLDDDLSAGEAAELRALLEADPALVQRLHGLLRDQVVCRTALRPADPQAIRERTQRMLDSWRPQSGEIAAQAVFARVDQRRRVALVLRWSSLAAAALVLVLIVPLVLDWARRPVAEPDGQAPVISALAGEVHLGALALTAPGERIGYGGSLRLGATGSATLTWSDGTRLTLANDTTVTRLPAAGQRWQLATGAVTVVAAKRPSDQPFEIICPDATVRVVGTAFGVRVVDGSTNLEVDEGLVRLTRTVDGVSSLIGAGQRIAATRLPLPTPVVMSVDHLAALRAAIAAGREPWASSHAALRREVPEWLADTPPGPTTVVVPAYNDGNPEHTAARRFLHQLMRPLIGLALAARLEGDAQVEAAARARLVAATSITLTGPDAGTLSNDMLVVFGLQAADLLRGLPSWQPEDSARIEAWIERDLQPLAERWQLNARMSSRWRGSAALISIAAWRGDQSTVLALMGDLRTSIAAQFTERNLTSLTADVVEDQTLFQALSHALFAADVARVAGGDITPPPVEWTRALELYLAGLGRSTETAPQQRNFLRALTGPRPWRSPDAAGLIKDTDLRYHTYAWYFPILVAHDPRWE